MGSFHSALLGSFLAFNLFSICNLVVLGSDLGIRFRARTFPAAKTSGISHLGRPLRLGSSPRGIDPGGPPFLVYAMTWLPAETLYQYSCRS